MRKPFVSLLAAFLLFTLGVTEAAADPNIVPPGKPLFKNPFAQPKLDEKTVIAGLKEALEIGTKNAIKFVSKANGYFKNPEIFIPMPDDLKNMADTLRRIGLKRKVDEFIETMNHAAEKAAPKAVDIFVNAVKRMSVRDAMRILQGPDDAATAYFEKNTRAALYDVFYPIIKKVLNDVGVTSLYKDLVKSYNAVPLTRKINFNLDKYVTDRALDGLFLMLAEEEKKIRKNPAARVTELLRKVFG